MADTSRPIELSQAEVVDSHCHPYRIAELLRRSPQGLEARCTFLGTCTFSTLSADPPQWSQVEELAESTVFALGLRRRLAAYFQCEPTAEAFARARDAAFRKDPVAYTTRLLQGQRIVGLLADEGHPQPPVPRAEFEQSVGVPVHRVARIEPWIAAHRERARGFDDFHEGVVAEMEAAATDPRCVAYKSVIAYRTGLDVAPVTGEEASAAFDRWRTDGWRETREHAKPVRDFLLRRALEIARRHDRPVHIHVGGGDRDINLAHARPHDLFPLLGEYANQPIVLIHAGYPWIEEAAYMAVVLPNVYLELSVLIPWGWLEIDRRMETLIGLVPTAKLLYGSDEASEPEVLWIAAQLAREALARTMQLLVDRRDLTRDEATRIARGVLAGNTRRLHGI
jgi:uncharacterized protein